MTLRNSTGPEIRQIIYRLKISAFGVNLASILIQPDSKIVVAGTFASANGLARTNLAWFNADGSLDIAFAVGFATVAPYGWTGVGGLALQPDGRLVVGGTFDLVDDLPRNGLARLNPDGSLDPGFYAAQDIIGATTPLHISALALEPDGDILVGCDNFNLLDLTSLCGLVRIHGTPMLAPPRINAISYLPGGRVSLSFFAAPGTHGLAQACTHWNDWTTLGPATDLGGGVFNFEDTQAAGSPWRFYRLELGD